MKYLFLAEKNSVMNAVEDAYRKNKGKVDAAVHGELIFTALSGHVCRWLEPSEYDEWKDKNWKDLELPLTPEPFVIAGTKEPYAAGVLKKVTELIKKERPDGYIVGTDSDVEGNGIFYLLSNYLHITDKPTRRFFEQSLTEKEIVDSLLHMTDFYKEPRDVRMTNTFIIRSQFDWLVGMNATIGVTLKSGELYKVGRVKAPTLKLVYDNSKAIDNFIPHSDFQIKAEYSDGFTGLMTGDDNGEESFDTKEKAEAFIESIENCKTASVKSVERKKVSTGAPALYKLSTLQGEAGSQYNLTPRETLDTVQSLYEKKLLTYPRTDGIHVSSQKAETFGALLHSISHVEKLSEYAKAIGEKEIERVKKNKRVVNDEEVKKSSHDALLPTDHVPDMEKLSEKEKKIYTMVATRFLSQFLPEKEDIKTVLLSDIDGHTFKSNGSITTEPGWSILYDKKDTSEKIPDSIKNGDTLNVHSIMPHEKVSKPPKRLTESSLVTAMENIAKFIDDKKLKEVMKEAKGIGTQATRADIIDQLIKTGYIQCEGKNNALYITDVGKRYIDVLKDFSITDPSSAAEWESMFKNVKEGTDSFHDAREKTIDYVYDFMEEIAKANIKARARTVETLSVKCPYCGGSIRKLKWGYACENSKDNGCTFKVTSFNGKLKDSDIKALIETGITRKIKAISKSKKTGKPFDAKLGLCEKGEENAIKYIFDAPETLDIKCPYCDGEIISYSWGYACENSKDNGCSFKVSNAGGKVTTEDLRELIEKKHTRLIPKVYIAKTGKSYDAVLTLQDKDATYPVKCIFPQRTKEKLTSTCPWCGGNIIKTDWNYECEKKCGFKVSHYHGQVTENDLKDLLKNGKTRTIEGLMGKNNKPFSATIKLNEKGSKYATSFEF